MSNINRLSHALSWRTLKQVRVRRHCALMICLCVAIFVVEARWAKGTQQFGEVHFPIACKPDVQREFDLAVAMLHTFSFPAAAKTFTAISQKDPECAMAYWGIAATAIGSLYGGRPGPMALQGKSQSKKPKP